VQNKSDNILYQKTSSNPLFSQKFLAVTDEVPQKKKSPAGKQSLFTPPTPGGEIIKVKKERSRRKTIFTIPPAAAGGIIKGKKRKAQWAFLFL
jgi:hypothetical protein